MTPSRDIVMVWVCVFPAEQSLAAKTRTARASQTAPTLLRVALFVAGGVLEVNADNDPQLFKMARVGLGCLGVVTELTMQV